MRGWQEARSGTPEECLRLLTKREYIPGIVSGRGRTAVNVAHHSAQCCCGSDARRWPETLRPGGSAASPLLTGTDAFFFINTNANCPLFAVGHFQHGVAASQFRARMPGRCSV